MSKRIFNVVLILFSSWTISYHLVLVTRWPYFLTPMIAVLIAVLLIYLAFYQFGDGSKFSLLPEKDRIPVVVSLILIGLLFGVFCASLIGDTADTIGFFYNPHVQSQNLRSPIFLQSKSANYETPLPALSGPHLMISAEQFVTLAGRLTNIQPAVVYHTLLPFFMGGFTVLAFYIVFTKLGLKDWEVVLSIIGVLAFLFISGYGHQFGNWLILKNYYGKGFLPATFIPVFLVYLLGYLKKPGKQEFFLLCLFGIAFSGAATSGPVYNLMMIGAMSLAFLVIEGFSKDNMRSAGILLVSGAYSFLLLGLMLSRVIPMGYIPSFMDLTTQNWYDEIFTRFFPNDITVIAYLLVLFVIPVLILKKRDAKYLLVYSFIIMLFFANNIISPIVIKLASIANQWRLFYLLPIPMLAGLLPVGLIRGVKRYRAGRKPYQLVLVMVTILAISIGSPEHIDLQFKNNIFDLKLEPQYQEFLDEYEIGKFSNSLVMSSEKMALALTLVDPSIRYYSDRPLYSDYYFSSLNIYEFYTRMRLQWGLSRCDRSKLTAEPETIDYLIAADVDYIVYENCSVNFTENFSQLLESRNSFWSVSSFTTKNSEEEMVFWIFARE